MRSVNNLQQEDTCAHLYLPLGAWWVLTTEGRECEGGGGDGRGPSTTSCSGVANSGGKQTDEARPARQTETREAAEH